MIIIIMTLLTATSHLWHQWWLIFLSTTCSLCVSTLPDQSPCNVWWMWHAKQEMLTPRAPDLTFFWGSHFCMAWTFYQFCLCPWTLWYMLIGFCSLFFLNNNHQHLFTKDFAYKMFISLNCSKVRNKNKRCIISVIKASV